MHLTRIYSEGDAAKNFPIANAGVKIIYFEHETID
jgi:hypothetical protein